MNRLINSSYFLWGGLICIVALAKYAAVLDLVGTILMVIGFILLISQK